MLINLSYYLGDNSKYKYFEDYDNMVSFIKKYLEVDECDFNTFEVTIYRGKEEERVRKLHNAKCVENEEVKNDT